MPCVASPCPCQAVRNGRRIGLPDTIRSRAVAICASGRLTPEPTGAGASTLFLRSASRRSVRVRRYVFRFTSTGRPSVRSHPLRPSGRAWRRRDHRPVDLQAQVPLAWPRRLAPPLCLRLCYPNAGSPPVQVVERRPEGGPFVHLPLYARHPPDGREAGASCLGAAVMALRSFRAAGKISRVVSASPPRMRAVWAGRRPGSRMRGPPNFVRQRGQTKLAPPRPGCAALRASLNRSA
jgi:hypothetical protein